MCNFALFAIWQEVEALVTNLALIWFLSCVGKFMISAVCRLFKALITIFAFIRSHLNVETALNPLCLFFIFPLFVLVLRLV